MFYDGSNRLSHNTYRKASPLAAGAARKTGAVRLFGPIYALPNSLLERLAMILNGRHYGRMKAYSDDLRKKIVQAVERGMPKTEAARSFGVGISSVKRYVAAARQGRSLAPKKRPGSKPKLDQGARRLLEADLHERPAATLPERREFLRRVSGVEVSDSTISRVLRRMGFSRKKDRWARQNATSS